jgi:hypothetical protein
MSACVAGPGRLTQRRLELEKQCEFFHLAQGASYLPGLELCLPCGEALMQLVKGLEGAAGLVHAGRHGAGAALAQSGTQRREMRPREYASGQGRQTVQGYHEGDNARV